MLVKIYGEESNYDDLTKMGIGCGVYDTYENCFTKCICPKDVIPKLKKRFKFCLEDTSDCGIWYA